MTKRVGVVGVGSPFGADNIAWHVIELLKKKLFSKDNKVSEANVETLDSKIYIEYFDRPGMYLLEHLKKFHSIHLIDAMMSGKPVGTIYRFEEIKNFQKNNQLLSSHGFGVAETLSLGEALNCLPEEIIIHGVEMNQDISACSSSQEMMRAVPILVEQLERELMV